MVKYSVAMDPFSGGCLVLEASTDFDGWVVLFHCVDLVEAHKQKMKMQEAQAELIAVLLREHGGQVDGQ